VLFDSRKLIIAIEVKQTAKVNKMDNEAQEQIGKPENKLTVDLSDVNEAVYTKAHANRMLEILDLAYWTFCEDPSDLNEQQIETFNEIKGYLELVGII